MVVWMQEVRMPTIEQVYNHVKGRAATFGLISHGHDATGTPVYAFHTGHGGQWSRTYTSLKALSLDLDRVYGTNLIQTYFSTVVPKVANLQPAYKAIGPKKKPLSFLEPEDDTYDEYWG